LYIFAIGESEKHFGLNPSLTHKIILLYKVRDSPLQEN